MTHRQRLETVFGGRQAERTPTLGGWIACPQHIASLAGVSLDSYWADPAGASLRAYEALDIDGLIDLFVPPQRDDFRCVDASNYIHARAEGRMEDTLAAIDALPEPEGVEAQLQATDQTDYAGFAASLRAMQARCGDRVWMPAQWAAGAQVTFYGEYGYERWFEILTMYEGRARKLIEIAGVRGRRHALHIARAVSEGLYPHAVLLGEDICAQRGPMISPRFLEEHYAPQLRRGLEPLLEAGCKPVWHCDGDVRPLLDMLIDCGVQGLQGFQPECGMTIEYAASRRTREGAPLLIFGPLAVTTELPCCTPEVIRQKVRHAIEVCRGQADLVLFSGNTINPDVPLANIRAMYEAVHDV